jgi:putative transposase
MSTTTRLNHDWTALRGEGHESFFTTMECELLDRQRFRTQAEARMVIFEFLEGWYNSLRRHSGAGNLSPMEYERKHATNG